ncbi:MAG: PorV/PorQ family protein [Spirochaetes bacterium]|nr:PorV/PorQ family protein [Spirochaetota bacterium]
MGHKSFFIILLVLAVIFYREKGTASVAVLMPDSFSARSGALNDAVVGLADDLDAISVNPAGLNTLTYKGLSFTYINYFSEIHLGQFVMGTSLPGSVYGGYLAMGFKFFSLPAFEQTDSQGNAIGNQIDAGDYVLTLGYANNPLKIFSMDKNLNLGFNAKYLKSRLGDMSKNSFAFDLGLLYKFTFLPLGYPRLKDNFSFGVSVQNLGNPLVYDEEETSLPKNFRSGIGYAFQINERNSARLGMDMNFPSDSPEIFNMGLEYIYNQILFLRAGYKYQKGTESHVSLGLGTRFPISGFKLLLDYAFIPHELSGKHMITLSFIHEKEKAVFRVDDEKEKVIIGLSEYKDKIFIEKKEDFKREGYDILDDLVDVIKVEKYKNVVIIMQTSSLKDDEMRLARKRGESVYNYFVHRGIDENRILHMVYEKPQQDGSKIIDESFKIIIIRWKEGEEQRFKAYYYNGLDAFIKEGYENAVEEWSEALKLDPDNKELKRQLEEAREKLKKKQD